MPFQIRDATPDDIDALARLHVQTFNETHRGGQPGGPSYELRARQWREAFARDDQPWFCLVATDDDGQLIGLANGALHDGAIPGFVGELTKIYVLRRFHRRGVGRLLLCNVTRRFISHGITSMLLFGEAASPSNGFYETFGAERLYNDRGGFDGGYGWRDLRILAAACEGLSA